MADFTFLKHKPIMYKLAIEAQKSLLNQQHRITALNCRLICESLIKEQMGSGNRYLHNLEDKIDHLKMEDKWKEKLHYIRKVGNKAAHQTQALTSQEALNAFTYTHQICQHWHPSPKTEKNRSIVPIVIGVVSAIVASLATVQTMKHIETNRKK